MERTFGVIGSPSSAGAFAPGQERAPRALREAGLIRLMEEAGIHVFDHGDLPEWRWRPDRGNPRAQNISAVVGNAIGVAGAVRKIGEAGEVALVLGGDCTVGLGTVAGSLSRGDRVGLIYFDLHADLNVPDSVEEGALDWMGMAHLLDEEGAVPELRDLGPRRPMLNDDQVLLFAHDPQHATSWELQVIERRSLSTIPIEVVGGDPAAAAATALQHADGVGDTLLVHLDVDVIDFTDAPLSENTGRNSGLSLEATFLALRTIVQDQRLAALTITELNPDHGEEDGSTIARFIEGLVGCLATDAPDRGWS